MAFLKRSKDPFTQIQNCLQKRDYKGALVWFKPLLDKDSKNTQVRLRYADTLVLAGSRREAIKQYRVVADELAEAGFMIRAIAINKKIVQLDPSQTDVHQKLAEMNEERSRSANAKSSLPLQMATPDSTRTPATEEIGVEEIGIGDMGMEEVGEEVGVEEIGVEEVGVGDTPTPVEAGPPDLLASADTGVAEPTLSLDESMVMEFGEALPEEPAETQREVEVGDVETSAADAETGAAPAEPEAVGFELTVEEEPGLSFEEPTEEPELESVEFDLTPEAEAPAEGPSFETGEVPSFEEEPVVPLEEEEVADQPEEELVLTLEEGPETSEELEGLEVVEAVAATGLEEELELEGGPEEPEWDLDIETEPDMAADGKDALVGLLGEDIDSMIDSIIDDVGSSVSGTPVSAPKAATRIPLFSDLTVDEFVDVAIMLARRSAKAGTVIVREGDPGDSMFIVSTGEVEATREEGGETVKLATLSDGDFFGEMAVLSGEPRSATVTVVKNAELLELSRTDLNTICSRHPHVEAKLRLAYDERSMQNQ